MYCSHRGFPWRYSCMCIRQHQNKSHLPLVGRQVHGKLIQQGLHIILYMMETQGKRNKKTGGFQNADTSYLIEHM